MRLANSLRDHCCWLRGWTVAWLGQLMTGDRPPGLNDLASSLPPRPQGGTVHPISAPAVCLLGTYAHFCSGFAFELICLPISDITLSSHPFLHILILYSPPPLDVLPFLWITSATYLKFLCCSLELLNTVTNLIFVFSVYFPSEHTTNCNVPHSNTFESVTFFLGCAAASHFRTNCKLWHCVIVIKQKH